MLPCNDKGHMHTYGYMHKRAAEINETAVPRDASRVWRDQTCLCSQLPLQNCSRWIDVFLAEAKVYKMDDIFLRREVSPDHEVGRFDIAINDAVRMQLLDTRDRLKYK